MNTHQDVEDLQQASELGRPVREHGPYRIQIGDELMNYRPVIVTDALPTGRQILEATGVTPVDEYGLFQVLPNGQIEGIRFDEKTDLRAGGREKFLAFHSDRSFRLELDGAMFEWGTGRIQGRVLKLLAKVDLVTYGVWMEVPGSDDLALDDSQFVSLEGTGVEHFFTGIVKTTEG